MKKDVDVSMYVSNPRASRIKPEEIDMGDLPPIQKPIPHLKQEALSEVKTERNSERTEFRTENRSGIELIPFPRKRRTTRYSFEFYEDQVYQLKELKHRREMKGEKVTLSDFAREALDRYIKAEKGK